MKMLKLREKEEWGTDMEPCWMRTGCLGLLDAIMWSYRDYRDASHEDQVLLLEKRLGGQPPKKEVYDLLHDVCNSISSDPSQTDEKQMFHTFIPSKIQNKILFPYCIDHIKKNTNVVWEEVMKLFIEKAVDLADETRRLKFEEENIQLDEIEPYIRQYVSSICSDINHTPRIDYTTLHKLCAKADIDVIILSPVEKVLFDSFTWDVKSYQDADDATCDVIVVLAHTDGYDSLGRYSFTKDGSKKVSRIFSPDDDTILALRRQKSKNVSINENIDIIP